MTAESYDSMKAAAVHFALSRENHSVMATYLNSDSDPQMFDKPPYYLNGTYRDIEVEKDRHDDRSRRVQLTPRTVCPLNLPGQIGSNPTLTHKPPHRMTAVIAPLSFDHGAS